MSYALRLRDAFIARLQNPDGMGGINAPWRHAGNGEIVDAEGLPVACISNFHEAQIPLILAAPALLAAAKEALVHVLELEDAWGRGALNECDGSGGTRSNRNTDVRCSLNSAIAKAEEPAP